MFLNWAMVRMLIKLMELMELMTRKTVSYLDSMYILYLIVLDHPFARHFANSDEADLARQILDVQNDKWLVSKAGKGSTWSSSFKYPVNAKTTLLNSLKLPRSSQDLNVRPSPNICIKSLSPVQLKQKLKQPAARYLSTFNDFIGSIASSIFNYQDLLLGDRSSGNAEDLRRLTCLHLLNHITKTRNKVIKNNARLAKDDNGEDLDLRDQGFTRPKTLVILPTRQSCVRYIDTIVSLWEPEQQENRKRFQDSYTQGEDDISEDKPADFRELFGGNDDDMFRLGVKFTRKTVKYFAPFYNSDVIFASPLGLRMALGSEDGKKMDHDFLSSIEVLIIDQADALQMQNWEHVEYIFDHLNLQPREAHGCDFSRVRSWYLDGHAKYLRQTILLSAFNFPSLNKLYISNMLNVAGKIKFSTHHDGVMLDLGIAIKQTFSRYESTSPVTDPDDRFNYFTSTIVPHLTRYSDSGTRRGQGVLIYVPLYADFVRVRNYLASSSSTQSISFGSISEYTSVRDVARARSHFFTGRHSVLLYTERAHHFRRYHLRGVKKVIMYGLPHNPILYREVVGSFLGSSIAEAKVEAGDASVRSLFSRLDILKLERIVGTERYISLLRNKGGDTFDFI